MTKNKRHEEILNILRGTEFASVRELAEKFGVSQMTIRRDLDALQRSEIVRTIYGGAVLQKEVDERLDPVQSTYNFRVQQEEYRKQKAIIGAAAAGYVSDGDVIIVDSGTTTEAFVRAIPPELSITIVCYAANIFDVARRHPNWRIILVGGHFHAGDLMFESNEGLRLIENTRTNRAFIAAGGVSDRLGLTCVNRYETETKNAAIRSSLSTVLLADSSKFGAITPSYFADLRSIDIVVTDNGISPEYREIISDAGVVLHIAEEDK